MSEENSSNQNQEINDSFHQLLKDKDFATLLNQILQNIDIDALDSEKKTGLWNAVLDEELNLVDFLIANNANIEVSHGGKNLIHLSLEKNNYAILELLLWSGLKTLVNTQNPMKIFPIQHATSLGNEKIVALLIEFGANPNVMDNLGNTALNKAFESKNEKIADTLSKAQDLDIEHKNSKGESYLYQAVATGHKNATVNLVCNGADIHETLENGKSILDFASEIDNSEIADLLGEIDSISSQLNAQELEMDGHIPTMSHFQEIDEETGELTTNQGLQWGSGDVVIFKGNGYERDKMTIVKGDGFIKNDMKIIKGEPWTKEEMVVIRGSGPEKEAYAVIRGNGGPMTENELRGNYGTEHIVTKFITKKENMEPAQAPTPDVQKVKSSTPPPQEEQKKLTAKEIRELLLVGCFKGQLPIIQHAIKEGADVNARHKDGQTTIMLAMRSNNTQILDFLIQEGAKVNMKLPDGRTPLTTAILSKNVGMCKYLLEKGAAQQSKYKGLSPLMIATTMGQAQMVQLLVQHGADINERNIKGQTALILAKAKKLTQIAEFLTRVKNGK
jgi:ankyrin repeat protein